MIEPINVINTGIVTIVMISVALVGPEIWQNIKLYRNLKARNAQKILNLGIGYEAGSTDKLVEFFNQPEEPSYVAPQLWYNELSDVLKILYPNGKVESYYGIGVEWQKSEYYTRHSQYTAIRALKKGFNVFISNIE